MDLFLSDHQWERGRFPARTPVSCLVLLSTLVFLQLPATGSFAAESLAAESLAAESLADGIPQESILFLHWQYAAEGGFASTYLGQLKQVMEGAGFLEVERLRMGERHMHPHLGHRQVGRVGHCHRQGPGMIRPGDGHLAALQLLEKLPDRHQVRKRLAGMVKSRLHVEDRDLCVLEKCREGRIEEVRLLILTAGKRAQPQGGKITGENTRGLFDMLRRVSVHPLAELGLQRKESLCIESAHIPTQLPCRHLEGAARTQGLVQKKEGNLPALKNVRTGVLLEGKGAVYKLSDLLG